MNDAQHGPMESSADTAIRIERTPSPADIENRFTYHQPKGDQTDRYGEIRSQARQLAIAIAELVPDSREKSVAMTNLEQAVMWANAGIARNE